MMTGGGTAGHVLPNLALVDPLREKGYRVGYIGRKKSIEERLAKEAGLPFYCISAGRLHRDFNMENWISPWLNIKGTAQACSVIQREKPSLIFCKGGFVSVPVAIAGHLKKVPVMLHESDMTPGLANRLCMPFADRICVSFEETLGCVPKGKAVYTGTPVRRELSEGSREKGYALTGLKPGKPVVLVMGGSSGAGAINDVVGKAAARLVGKYEIVHLCGRQRVQACRPLPGYCPMGYVGPELKHLYAMADLIVSRAGAGALAEIRMLKKPNILIPLPKAVSRGDQIINARAFGQKGYSLVLSQEQLSEETLLKALEEVHRNKEKYVASMSGKRGQDGTGSVLEAIEKAINLS